MNYITLEEYKELGFAEVDDFSDLRQRAEMAVDLYTNYFYQNNNLEDDFPPRKHAVKLAIANQIRYLNETGILTAEDKHSLGSLALDTMNLLKSVGFGYRGVCYDR